MGAISLNQKKQVGYKAAEYIKNGMIVGLGTGSTAYYLVEALGKRVKEEGLSIVGVTTSTRTKEQAESLGIPLKDIDDVEKVDITIDGANITDITSFKNALINIKSEAVQRAYQH